MWYTYSTICGVSLPALLNKSPFSFCISSILLVLASSFFVSFLIWDSNHITNHIKFFGLELKTYSFFGLKTIFWSGNQDDSFWCGTQNNFSFSLSFSFPLSLSVSVLFGLRLKTYS